MNYLYILYLSHFDVEMQNQLLKTENAENGPPPSGHESTQKTEPPSRSEKSPSAVKIP